MFVYIALYLNFRISQWHLDEVYKYLQSKLEKHASFSISLGLSQRQLKLIYEAIFNVLVI